MSGSFSGSLTIGNENPFQAHSVLETSFDFRLILRLENAVTNLTIHLRAGHRRGYPGEVNSVINSRKGVAGEIASDFQLPWFAIGGVQVRLHVALCAGPFVLVPIDSGL